MYICRKCSTSVDEADRFCTGCGAYIGEPVIKKDNWEAANSYEKLQVEEEHAELIVENTESKEIINVKNTSTKNINKDSKSLIYLAMQTSDALSAALENTNLRSIIKISALVIAAVPLLISFIIRWSLIIPNDLIDIILPINLLGIDFKGMLSLPGSMLRSFAYSLFGFLMLLPIIFLVCIFPRGLYLK